MPPRSPCPTASRSGSRYADRLELDDDGRVVVIDLKTGKYPPTDKDLPRTRSSALYQLAVDHGAVDDLVAAPGRPDPAAPSWCSCASSEVTRREGPAAGSRRSPTPTGRRRSSCS